MVRLSSLTIGLFVLVIVVLGVGIYLVARPRHPIDIVSVPAGDLPSAPPLGSRETEVQRRPMTLPPVVLDEPPPQGEQANSVDGSTGSDGLPGERDRQDGRETATTKRGLLIALNNQKRREEADERVFEVRKMPETTRVAIRQLNEAYTDRIRASWKTKLDSLIAGAPPDTAPPHTTDAERARRDAIDKILGVDTGREFGAAERVSIQQVRGKYRLEQARLLRQ